MAETKKNAAAYQGFVRTEEAPLLPPPPSETGITGWLWQNVVSSCADFTSVGASIRSLLMAAFTVFVAWLTVSITWSLVDFAFLSAVWSDPEGIKREACWTEEQGGALPNGWHGACWPFITTKMKFFIYGPYESTELWRVNLTGLIGLVGLVWVLIERLPYRRHMGVFLLTGYPLIAIVLLTGGAFEVSYGSLSVTALIGLGLISIGRLSRRELLGDTMTTFAGVFGVVGWLLVVYAGIMLVLSADVGLEAIDTNDWGGLLITLVVAVTGIV
ncbi:MAG: amino acid ABC transporter permease, partial [Pseudomonadota bacterium]|nr:amino acid ABC transporter permease [Pseudomonadota bacterium]